MEKSYILALSIAIGLAAPFTASAAWLPYSGGDRIGGPTLEQGSLERNQILHKVADFYDNRPSPSPVTGTRLEVLPTQKPDSGKPDNSSVGDKGGTQPMNQPYGYPADSLKGHTGGPNMWPGSRAEGDPMVRSLSEMNSGLLNSGSTGSSLGR